MSIREEKVTLKPHKQDSTGISAYHFVDEERTQSSEKKKGGLVVIMEIFGINHHIHQICREYAQRGYRVLAPQIYDRLEKDFSMRYTKEGVKKSLEVRDRHDIHQGVRDIQSGIHWLKNQGETHVFSVGYCYGGSLVWLSAASCDGLSAGASYYGGRIREFVNKTPRCPVILHFGGQDPAIPLADIEDVQTKHPDIPVHIYEGADHGFNCDDPERAVHHQQAAQTALERTLYLLQS